MLMRLEIRYSLFLHVLSCYLLSTNIDKVIYRICTTNPFIRFIAAFEGDLSVSMLNQIVLKFDLI